MKRLIKPLVALAVVATVGAGGVAWAHNAEERAARRDSLKVCAEQVDRTDREAMAECMTAAGYPPPQLTEEQKEQREAAKGCMAEAREAHAGDRRAVIEGARACMAEAGIEHPGFAMRPPFHARAHRCFAEAREAHAGDPRAVHQAVHECLHQGP